MSEAIRRGDDPAKVNEVLRTAKIKEAQGKRGGR